MVQIRQCLIAFEGQAKPSKIKSVVKRRSKCISMVIAETASRNVTLKSAESVFACQSDVLIRQVAMKDLIFDEADFEDLSRNADLYIFNQDDRQD